MLTMPSNTSPAIDSQLKQALGNRKPAEVWSEILEKVGEFYWDNPGALEVEARQYNEDDPNLVIQMLEKSDPVKALQLLHEISPSVDLQHLDKLSPDLLAKAALQIFAE